MEDQRQLQPIKPEDADAARSMFSEMAFIRSIEEKALALTQSNPPQVMGSMHFCAGQEAVPVGAMKGLRDDDQVLATYRGHGWALAAGLDSHAVMAEICQRRSGLNGGRAGSAYLMAPHSRFIGENSIVGAGTTIACGVALANKAKANGRVVVVTIGDGAMNQGAVHEALAFAAARQLAVIFVVENNGWSELTPTSEMFRVERLAQRASGYGIPSATVAGNDPLIVRDSFIVAAERARKGLGPSLIEFKVPRLWGHYNRDVEHYRPKDDKNRAIAQDPLSILGARLINSKLLSPEGVEELKSAQVSKVESLSVEVMLSPAPDPDSANANVIAIASPPAPTVKEVKELTYIEAVNAALRAELEADDRTLVYGEDVGKSGGIFQGSRYLQRDFGPDRVFDMPIAENAIMGSAVGAALSGMKPIVEIMWADFLFVALDQLINQAANVRYVTGGQCSVPMVVRTQQGATPGSCAQHSQSIEAILAHIPGLKVGLAATADDAYSMLRAAAADPDPCVIIEARGLYQTKAEVTLTEGAEAVGRARLRRSGADCVVITWGTMVPQSLLAATELAEVGINASVLDLRWLSPLDESAIREAVKSANGRVLIVHEAVRTGGFAGEIALRITELCPDMPLTVERLTTPDVRIPASPELQRRLIPNAATIAQRVQQMMAATGQLKRRVAG